jgi:hypothetical protein
MRPWIPDLMLVSVFMSSDACVAAFFQLLTIASELDFALLLMLESDVELVADDVLFAVLVLLVLEPNSDRPLFCAILYMA